MFEHGVVAPAERGTGLWFVVRQGEVLLVDDDGAFVLPRADDPSALGVPIDGEPHYLGSLDGTACFGVGAAAGSDGFVNLRALWGRVPEDLWTLAGRAVQIIEWDRTHRFCGRCATPTDLVAGERARRCPACALTMFPRLAPAVIVLVERGEGGGEVLLANGRNFGAPMYSCLAGFVEPGETLEEAVHREVAEEVGVTLADVHYVASQPWPFPHSLMIGFTATWAAGELVLDESEIVDAGWFRPDSLPLIPPRMSIARFLIDAWLARQAG